MKTMECRSCGSSDRYQQEVNAQGPYGLNLLPIKIGIMKAAKFRVEICGSCGLTEWFVPDRYLAQVKQTLPKISN